MSHRRGSLIYSSKQENGSKENVELHLPDWLALKSVVITKAGDTVGNQSPYPLSAGGHENWCKHFG